MEDKILDGQQPLEAAAAEQEDLKVQAQATKPVIVIEISGDRLSATIELARTSILTSNPEVGDVETALHENSIVYGINEGLVSALCQKPVYNMCLEIAKGKPAKTGESGYLKYLIDKKRDLKPAIGPDGTVDYRNMGFIQNVEQDQRLCEVYHAEQGDDGCDIYGGVIEGFMGKEPEIPTGTNTRYDEEESAVLANVSGNVLVDSKGVINVYDILKIRAVDNSTGDIQFGGDVIIDGDVISGFKVDTQGNIVVKGTVEGATLIAKGDIMVGTAINGMNSAKIITDGALKCKYIQNCRIEAGSNIYADSIMYCNIECNGSIELSGKRGALIGGQTVIADTLIVKSLGTAKHVKTGVTMAGGSLRHDKELKQIKKNIGALDAELISMVQTITWCNDLLKNDKKLKPFQQHAYEQSKSRLETIQVERNEMLKELEAVQTEFNAIDPLKCYIKCTAEVHTGVRIAFGTQIMQVSASFANSLIFLKDGEIAISPQ